jgi:hypothetical protein
MSHLSVAEAERIVALISSDLRDYVGRYDTRKYPADVYDRIRRAFSAPKSLEPGDIKSAILWKYGHLGKSGYPKHHVRLIENVQQLWPAFLQSKLLEPEAIEEFWANELGRPKPFITIAFLVHLLHQHDLPIIDQHNYRAVNYYMRKVVARGCRSGCLGIWTTFGWLRSSSSQYSQRGPREVIILAHATSTST